MRRISILMWIICAVLAGAAWAQINNPGSGLTASQVDAKIAPVQAAIPTAANAAPVSESNAPAIGTQTMKYALEDHVHPRITRSATVTTDASGNWSVTWTTALSAVPTVLPIPINSGLPIVCNVATRTTTAATGNCQQARALPATLTLLTALVSYLVFQAPPAGTSVQVLAIPPTQ